MSALVPRRSCRPRVRDGRGRIVVCYLMALVFIPQLVLGLGLLSAWHAEWVYSFTNVPLFLYCAPAVAVFGRAHFFAHATLCPADWNGWARVVSFYGAASLMLASLHILARRRTGIAEPAASPNGGPATPLRDSGAAKGPPSVS